MALIILPTLPNCAAIATQLPFIFVVDVPNHIANSLSSPSSVDASNQITTFSFPLLQLHQIRRHTPRQEYCISLPSSLHIFVPIINLNIIDGDCCWYFTPD